MVPFILQGDSPGVYPFDEISAFFSKNFLVRLRYSLLIFSFISACLIVSSSSIPEYMQFHITQSVLILSWFSSSFPSVVFFFLLLIISMAHFSMWNSISLSWLYIIYIFIRVPSSFSFFLNSSMLFMLLMLVGNVFLRFRKFAVPSAFSKYMTIIDSNNNSGLWLNFYHSKSFPSVVSSTFQFYMASVMNFITCWISCKFLDSLFSSFPAGLYHLPFFCR